MILNKFEIEQALLIHGPTNLVALFFFFSFHEKKLIRLTEGTFYRIRLLKL